ncbi:3'(2'),5'-bisphosphate nucleotidase CysQ [Litoribrevibacter albus]|uniref:3'(2'),5'-bisphosphate nucleotidase CysQ n=1 Tax=Litoribrevibacter albus TaxID=1473156 RepID=A0AA37SCE9_9GAMM|nr:3'(2'),5'-bisphosphate nucleotidase CysQ [Litoribrevibacter albus]GLQ32225.1 3'(2'),5'-bisphosphate nucleotidase CysQ [Litoribrevibacter albus]
MDSYVSEDTLAVVKDIAIKAGLAIMDIYQQDFSVYEKSDESPLTEADLAAHKIICEQLKQAFPTLPILSEESTDITYEDRKNWQTFWLVDPLDGTKEFIKKNDEFTVNIALIDQGRPVLGVVYVPALGVVYLGAEGLGAKKVEAGEETAIKVREYPKEQWIILGSRSHQSEHMVSYLQLFERYELISRGSSLKFCMIAEGAADLYPRLGPTSEWDTAAAHAVVVAAGGVVNDKDGNPLRYNKENILNPWFFVHHKDLEIPTCSE